MIEEILIRKGVKEDAPFIGKTITEAMGHELCVGLAEGEEKLPNVLKLFTDLQLRIQPNTVIRIL